ncbi:MAG: hypothetical protein Ct9H300mP1_16660 [Planctomycetaceae bacterium]|nr:MAG: hypothetical protein Ct9H300mP1_16660 [Planctomycetaceae bacterium]
MSTIKTYPGWCTRWTNCGGPGVSAPAGSRAADLAAVLGVLVLAVAADNLLAPGVGGRVVACWLCWPPACC